MRKPSLLLLSLFLFSTEIVLAQDPLLDILGKELSREFSELKKQDVPAYFMSYRVADQTSLIIMSSFGTLDRVQRSKTRQLTTMMRVGSPELDNFHELTGMNPFMPMSAPPNLPIVDDEKAIQQVLWQSTNENYFQAVQRLTQIKGKIPVNVAQEDKSLDFVEGPAVQYAEQPLKTTIDKSTEDKLINRMKLYSKVFTGSKEISNCIVQLAINFKRDYFVSSSGSRIVENHPQIYMNIVGASLADDGMEMQLYKSYFATNLKDLPKDEDVLQDANELVKKLEALKVAPVVDPYSGPALMSGKAAGVFFHEIFGHRVEASRMKSENDAQTFKSKVGQPVVNNNLSIIFDPTATSYKGFNLAGSYNYDDFGEKSQKVTVVSKGVLKDFLTCNTPITGFLKSNGHGRAQVGMNPVSRQSNMIIESDHLLSEADLKRNFIEEIKKQNLSYGYYFKEVSGGNTMNSRIMPNAFTVLPLEVYKVFADGKPDQLVRGISLVGTPLAMFAEIEAMGGEYGLFNGTCGAESGGVPVSSICPMMFVKKIEIQKRQKSSNIKPILDNPLTIQN